MQTLDTVCFIVTAASLTGMALVLRAKARRDERAARNIIDRRLSEVVRRTGPAFAFIPPRKDEWTGSAECDPRLSGPGDPGPPEHCERCPCGSPGCVYRGDNEYLHG